MICTQTSMTDIPVIWEGGYSTVLIESVWINAIVNQVLVEVATVYCSPCCVCNALQESSKLAFSVVATYGMDIYQGIHCSLGV